MENNLRIILSLGFAIVISGCAAERVTASPASNSERQAASATYMNCLIPYAKRLDDGRSDAKTIAQAMRGACPKELGTVYETMSRGENEPVKQGIRRGLSSIEESSALQVVLDARNSKSGANP